VSCFAGDSDELKMNNNEGISLSGSGESRLISPTDATNSITRSVFDKLFAVAVLIFGIPFIVVICVIMGFSQGWPIVFTHKRVGLHGREFGCFKFRTMVVDAEARVQELIASDPNAREQWEKWRKLDNDPRVTCVGRFLRKTALDELPQFLNVLKGDMAIVGPRPIVRDEIELYGNHVDAYLSTKPGITGLWQVEAKEIDTYNDRVALDMEYLRRRSFWLDMQIILRTALLVVRKGGSG
jgi:exopolysaccharide production protein ExoY